MDLEVVKPRWQSCIVAAPGPSLVPVEGHPIIAVQDAYKLVPWADVMYGCDPKWWANYAGDFKGELWSTHHEETNNNKEDAQSKWGVRCVKGDHATRFSMDPSVIHYGSNSGFQAVNLAIHFGCTTIVLVGFNLKGCNMFRAGDGDGSKYAAFIKNFQSAAEKLPPHIQIINATPDSALTCFPHMELADAQVLLDQTEARLAPVPRKLSGGRV